MSTAAARTPLFQRRQRCHLKPRGVERLLNYLARHRRLTTVGVFIFTTIVAIVDVYTGDDIPLMIVYLPAILVTCWIQNLSAGVALSLVCAVLWLIDDFFLIEVTPNLHYKYWLALVHLVFFMVIAVMTWRLRLSQERELLLSHTDALTCLLNRKAFREAAERETERCRRSRKPLAIAYFDCDNFKTVNDTLGHATGDELLQLIAATATRGVRRTDIVARLGGDEFACLLPETTAGVAEQVIGRMKSALDVAVAARDWPVSFSIGLVVFATPPRDVDRLIGAADELMYRVKRGAKNAVLVEEKSTEH
jgi:diguanylate cyclase (GGDEF)-like protein